MMHVYTRVSDWVEIIHRDPLHAVHLVADREVAFDARERDFADRERAFADHERALLEIQRRQ